MIEAWIITMFLACLAEIFGVIIKIERKSSIQIGLREDTAVAGSIVTILLAVTSLLMYINGG